MMTNDDGEFCQADTFNASFYYKIKVQNSHRSAHICTGMLISPRPS